ncbi:MAG TPA: aromatic ring-hydroxylating dioxygenase subunit alpha [Burkholderiales bacterium]|nr:aromatic ring-hydroxylating dioxygenase subunit alpha [Burkholderiales bacterium]
MSDSKRAAPQGTVAARGNAAGDGQGSQRSPGMTWDQLAAADSRPVPEFLREDTYRNLGSEPLAAERYTSAEFYQREIEKMWPNVWQFAAREEEMLEPHSVVVYENAGRSYLLTRQADGSVRAFHNVCLHRGRKLRTENGRAKEFRCPFHGFTWKTDGTLAQIPCKWDFPHLDQADMSLPEAQVGRWGGYIFIKENEGGPTLEEYLAPLPEHFKRWRHEDCHTALWAAKVVAANWKATAEAFMEAYHSIATHPQILPFTGDANTKYNLYGDHVNLALTPFGVTSPHLADQNLGPQQIIDNFVRYNSRVMPEGTVLVVPEGHSARETMGEFNRLRLSKMTGRDLGHASDSELQDAFTYNVFPNFSPWGGFTSSIVYRWRPWHDQDHTLMEVRTLTRLAAGQPMPPAPRMRLLAPDEPWGSALGQLGSVIDQDMGNLPYVQEGLKASKSGKVQLANYQEVRIRHFHQTLDKYLER